MPSETTVFFLYVDFYSKLKRKKKEKIVNLAE